MRPRRVCNCFLACSGRARRCLTEVLIVEVFEDANCTELYTRADERAASAAGCFSTIDLVSPRESAETAITLQWVRLGPRIGSRPRLARRAGLLRQRKRRVAAGPHPGRRRSRYGDIDYDFDHGVDTTWATVSMRTRIRELLSGGRYQPSEPSLFHQILRALPVAPDGFTFIDLGSGKGRTLLMASDYPFQRIIGVEFLGELNAVACENIARYHGDRQKSFALESRAGDARDFAFPEDPTVLYLFNPFPENVLLTVLTNLHDSWTCLPRPLYVLYHNLVHESVFASQEWLQPVYRAPEYAIYRARAR